MRVIFFTLLLSSITLSLVGCSDNAQFQQEDKEPPLLEKTIIEYIIHIESQGIEELREQPIYVSLYEKNNRKYLTLYTSAYPPVILDSNSCFVMKSRIRSHDVYVIDYLENPIGKSYYQKLDHNKEVDCESMDYDNMRPYTDIEFKNSRWHFELIQDTLKRVVKQ